MKSTEQVLSLNSPAVLKTRPPHRLGGAHRHGAGYLLLCWCNGWGSSRRAPPPGVGTRCARLGPIQRHPLSAKRDDGGQ